MERFGVECKKLMTEDIKERLKTTPDLFISSFNTLAVPEQDELRHKLKEIEASFFVVKNRIAKKVFRQLNLGGLGSIMQGLTAITTGGGDAISVSKALVGFASKHESFKILGAYVDEQILDQNSIKELAAIHSKEALLAQVIFGVKSPIQGLVNTLSATIKKFVVVLDKIREKK